MSSHVISRDEAEPGGRNLGWARAGRWALAAGVVAAGVTLSACGSSDNSVTGTVNGHSYSASSGQLPSGWPSDVPTPANARVLGGAGTGSTYDAAFALSGSVTSGMNAYHSKLQSAGYTVTQVQAGAASGPAGSAAGAEFTATNAQHSITVAAGKSTASGATGTLKPGEYALNVTVTPAG